jgi:hypothetical protein
MDIGGSLLSALARDRERGQMVERRLQKGEVAVT